MVNAALRKLIGLNERIGRAFYGPCIAITTHDSPGESGFAGAQHTAVEHVSLKRDQI